MATKKQTVESFTDPLGQVYKPGDVVAISIIDSRSPRTVYGVVDTIFVTDNDGNPLVNHKYNWDAEAGTGTSETTDVAHVRVKVYKRTRWQYGSDDKGRLQTYKLSDNITKLAVTADIFE